jgi:purine nucleosidase
MAAQNALDILYCSGLAHIPVYVGQSQPLMRPVVVCPEIHGESGLGGPSFPAHTLQPASEQPAFLALYDTLKQHPGEVVWLHHFQFARFLSLHFILILRLLPGPHHIRP